MNVADLLAALDRIAPRGLGENWDNNGLLFGRSDRPVASVLLGTDFTEGLVAEAKAAGAQAIVTHHPVMLKAVNRLSDRDPEQRAILSAVEAGIAHIAAHTNLDSAVGGTNDTLADLLGLTGVRPLTPAAAEEQLKLAVFVPEGDVDKVRSAMCAAGAGRIGEYDECSFRTPGTGTFRGSDASNPAVGQRGRLEEAPEYRLEVVLPARRLDAVVAAMRSAHSYEEPAFDVYPLKAPAGKTGMGRIGDLPAPRAVDDLVTLLKAKLEIPTVGLIGPRRRSVRRVAICTGSCGKLIGQILGAGGEFYLTGEMRHHDALSARESGLTVAAVGHFASERIALFPLAERLRAALPGVTVAVSRTESDPFVYV
jgi:dinuclear metal center YbgI/SA1388 family protein